MYKKTQKVNGILEFSTHLRAKKKNTPVGNLAAWSIFCNFSLTAPGAESNFYQLLSLMKIQNGVKDRVDPRSD